MISLLNLKARAVARANDAQKILDVVAGSEITREMTPEEKASFECALADVKTMKGQIAQMSAMDAETVAVEALDVPAERSIRRSTAPGDAPAVHTEKRDYSMLKALRTAADQRPQDGLEGEVSREIERQKGTAPRTFYMPTGSDPEIARLMYPSRKDHGIRRDLTTATGPGSIFNVPEASLIELLRAKLVLKKLGCTMLTGMKGTFSMIRQNGKSTVYWLGESASATNSNPTYDQVPFTPKVAIDAIPISRQFLNQTSLDAESQVKVDLSDSMAREVDRVGIAGTGTTQPLGICANTTIIANSTGLALGANGGPMTYAAAIAMESQVSNFNADEGKLAYLTSPAVRGELKQTPLIGTTFPTFVWGKGAAPGEGEVNDYRALATTNVPTNLTKGTTTGTCKAVIFGNWADLVIAEWEGIDVLVNPYTLQNSGGVIISLQISIDVEVRHPESFALILDAV